MSLDLKETLPRLRQAIAQQLTQELSSKARQWLNERDEYLQQWQYQLQTQHSLQPEQLNAFIQQLDMELAHCRRKLNQCDHGIDWRFDYYRLLRGMRHDLNQYSSKKEVVN